jgi:type III secretory pathway component EscU
MCVHICSCVFSKLMGVHVSVCLCVCRSSCREVFTYLVVEVEDAGIGLSNSAMAKLFEPFQQAQRMTGGTVCLFVLVCVVCVCVCLCVFTTVIYRCGFVCSQM